MTSQKVYILRYLILLLPVIGILWACTDDGVIDPSHGHDLGDRDGDLVRKAKLRADGLRDFFSLPDLSRTYGKVQTRSGGMSSYTLRGGDFTLDWDRVHRFVEENGDEVLIVPINLTSGVAIRRFSIIGNKRRVEQTPMRSFYYVKKHGATNRLVCRILSYAPSRNYLKKHKDEAGIEWYNPQGTDYSGLFLVSSLNGTIMHGVNYEKGHRKYFFRPNIPKDAKTVTRSVVADSCHHEHSNELIELAASDIYFSMRMITSTSSVSAYSYDDETYDGGCLFCGKTVENCECNFVVGGEEEEEDDDTYNDAYCPICNFDECTCLQFCDVCGQSIYMCTCNLDGDDAGGTAFPGGGGGNTSSGGSSGETRPVPIGVDKIIQATTNSVDKVINNFGNKKAYCNMGVNYAFQELFGSAELNNMNANTMVRYWIESSNWTEITLDEAQMYANNGLFTVGGWINPALRTDGTEQSGHVVVVVPGETQKGWGGMDLPGVMDTGGGMRVKRQGLNYSFGRDKKDKIRFFYYNK